MCWIFIFIYFFVCWNLYTFLKTDFQLFVKMFFFFIIHPTGIHSNFYFIIFNFINLILFFLLVKLARDLSVSFFFFKEPSLFLLKFVYYFFNLYFTNLHVDLYYFLFSIDFRFGLFSFF